MANPFLMMDDEIEASAAADAISNPFLMQQDEDENCPDNPFVAQANNPFAGFGDESDLQEVPAAAPSSTSATTDDPAMSFFGTTISDFDDEVAAIDSKPAPIMQLDGMNAEYWETDAIEEKKDSQTRPLPPSQTTQDLIFAVADQLDQASSHLLDRIPRTRTPSPVSMRDLHSPSPTPDAALVDFFDVSDGEQLPNDASTSNIGPADNDFMASDNDNPFAAEPISIAPVINSMPIGPLKSQPPRPPPPRPLPPRPTPPANLTKNAPPIRPSVPAPNQPTSTEPDLFDMFGDTQPPPKKPPPPKTKEDIMSLFSSQPLKTNHQAAQPDFLSGDLFGDIPPSDLPNTLSQTIIPPASAPATEVQPPVTEAQPPVTEAQPLIEDSIAAESMTTTTTTAAQNLSDFVPIPDAELVDDSEVGLSPQPTTTVTEPQTAAFPIDEAIEVIENLEIDAGTLIMDSITPEIMCKRAPTPDIEITTVESLPRSDDEEEPEPVPLEEIQPDTELTQAITEDVSNIESTAVIPEEVAPIPASTDAKVFAASDVHSEPEQMDTGLDFTSMIPSGSVSANPFASPDMEDVPAATNMFAATEVPIQPEALATNIFAVEEPISSAPVDVSSIFGLVDQIAAVDISAPKNDAFDAFSAKFDSAKKEDVNLLDGFGDIAPTNVAADAWGNDSAFPTNVTANDDGFGIDDGFDSFLSMRAPVQAAGLPKKDSIDSLNDNDKEFNVVIRPKEGDTSHEIAPILAPPPRNSATNSVYSGDSSPRFNPFDKGEEATIAEEAPAIPEAVIMKRTDSQETPPTPLFDEDVSQPLEDFPRVNYTGPGWEMQLRQPNKKKITGQRFWKKIFIKLICQGDNPVLQLYNLATDKEPFQELPLQPSYSVSDIGAQQYDQFGKIFTVKLQYIFYKERPGVRPGQVTKAERLTNKLSQFAAYAIQGDYQGVKEFGSDLKKLGLPVEHAPQLSQLFKIGSMSFEDLKQFSVCIDEALFKLAAHRDRALNYKSEEVQITAVDELYVEQDSEGRIEKQIARVRLFFLGFLSGMPSVELGVNDLWRQGKEVVGRHDIIPVVTEEWIRLEGVEFHSSVQQDEYERSRTIKFQPPDACYIELMRFRVRPPKNRELPFQLKATWCVTGNRVELRADILVPGFASRKLGQIPCEDVAIRFPIPECWIYLFRVEKHFRYGSVKSAHRRTGKIKGIERILGTVDTLQESLIEVTSGQAKYEHHHRSIVWRCPRLPKEGQGAYTTHQMVCRMALTSFDQIPEQLAPYCYVEFTMPATQVSHTTVRSVSIQDSDSDEPPEKYVRYLARHEYRVGIEHTTGETQNPYLVATKTIKEEPQTQPLASPMAPSDSDSDSN